MSALPSYVQTVSMPALSPTMDSGKLNKWHVDVGAYLEPGDVLCQIETDKASLDFEMQDEGYIAQLLVTGGDDDLPVGAPIALIVEDEEWLEEAKLLDVSSLLKPHAAPAAAPSPAPAPSAAALGSAQDLGPSGGDGADLDARHIFPAARHILASAGVDATRVQGTGRGGRITKGDALAFLAGGGAPAAAAAGQQAAAAPAPSAPSPAPAAAAPPPAADVDPLGRSTRTTAPSGVRKVIARRLAESKATVPHTYATAEIEVEGAMSARKALIERGVRVSLNDLIVRACALALRDMPHVNSFFDAADGAVRQNETVDVSVAVATEGGLITPIVRSADRRGLSEISADAKDLAGRARAGKLAPSEYQGGSFTISNLGMFGIDAFSAVVNPPQACILAVSRSQRRLVPALVEVEEEEEEEGGAVLRMEERLRVASVLSVTLSSDRRVVDDGDAAEFLQVVRAYLEEPERLML